MLNFAINISFLILWSKFRKIACKSHVETCVLLVKEHIHDDDLVSIKVDLDGISLNQGKYETDEKPTYGNIKKWIKEKYGLNVSSLYIAQIKDKAGIKERENYNIGSGEGKVLHCPPEKEKAIMNAFRHFGLIWRQKTQEASMDHRDLWLLPVFFGSR